MLGYPFLRQRPIHNYIADFYCPTLKLVIEIDGESHRNKFEGDQTRQKNLESLGLSTLVHKYGNQDSFTQRVAIFRLSHLDHDG